MIRIVELSRSRFSGTGRLRVLRKLKLRKVNRSRLQVGLSDGQALALWNVDQGVPEDTQKVLSELTNVRSVQLIRL